LAEAWPTIFAPALPPPPLRVEGHSAAVLRKGLLVVTQPGPAADNVVPLKA
jgi:hypothetical protein